MKQTTVTLLYDGSPGGTGKYYVTATVGRTEYPLGRYADALEAATVMGKWVHSRGLEFAPDSARRLDAVKRTDADMLTLDVWTKEALAAHAEARRTAWQRADYYPYIHIAHRMGL